MYIGTATPATAGTPATPNPFQPTEILSRKLESNPFFKIPRSLVWSPFLHFLIKSATPGRSLAGPLWSPGLEPGAGRGQVAEVPRLRTKSSLPELTKTQKNTNHTKNTKHTKNTHA